MKKTLKFAGVFAGVFLFAASMSAAHASMAPTKPAPLKPAPKSTPFLHAEQSDAYAAALEFVKVAGLTKNLSLLLLEEVKQSVEVNAAIDRDGMDSVQGKVVHAIRSAQKTHGGEWADVLARAYSQYFTADEMQSILKERENSAHFIRLIQLQEKLAETIRLEGSTVFNQARSEVLGTVAFSFSR